LNLTGTEKAVFARNLTGKDPATLNNGVKLKLQIDPAAFATTMLTAYCDGKIVW
jgi:hypothetical protein